MGEIEPDLLIAARNINDLPLRGRCWAKKSLICNGLLLEDVSAKKPILVGQLEIDTPGSLVVIKTATGIA